MLKRFLEKVNLAIKSFRMSEKISEGVSDTSKKRPHPDKKGKGKEKKKMKSDSAPFTGRLDRKRKVALMFGYCGKGYYGLQINKGFRTIEADVVEALVKVGLIPQDHAENMGKMSFQRAARTDKGVSAISNLFSLKIKDTVPKLNEALPEQIRVFGIVRTTNGFNSKNFCCARTYIYILPTFAFAPFEKIKWEKINKNLEKNFITDEYRTTDESIDKVNEILQMFKGTHNFHNYTSQIKPNDPSAKRYIMSFECSKPFIRDGIEFAQIKVKGQSFMMHHIRKMIGITIAIVKGFCGPDVLEKSWGPQKVDIPKAPGLGLVLETLHYDGYNKYYGSDGVHEAIDASRYKEEIEAFKEKHIISEIVKTEKEEKSMLKWLGSLVAHSYDIQTEDGERVWSIMREKMRDKAEAKAEVSQNSSSGSEEEKEEEILSQESSNVGHSDSEHCEKLTESENDVSEVGECKNKIADCVGEDIDIIEENKARTEVSADIEKEEDMTEMLDISESETNVVTDECDTDQKEVKKEQL